MVFGTDHVTLCVRLQTRTFPSADKVGVWADGTLESQGSLFHFFFLVAGHPIQDSD